MFCYVRTKANYHNEIAANTFAANTFATFFTGNYRDTRVPQKLATTPLNDVMCSKTIV